MRGVITERIRLILIQPIIESASGECHPLIQESASRDDSHVSRGQQRIRNRSALAQGSLAKLHDTLHGYRLFLLANTEAYLFPQRNIQAQIKQGVVVRLGRIKSLVKGMRGAEDSPYPGILKVQGAHSAKPQPAYLTAIVGFEVAYLELT